MTPEVIIRPRAADDLEALYDHIARDSPERAIGYLRRVRQRCLSLSDFPESGRSRDDLRAGLRLIAFERRLVIAYAVASGRVEILRVFYRGRDVDALLSDAGSD